MGCSLARYVASPKVDPQLDLRGGTMHIRNRCRGAVGDCWRKMGLIWPTRGSDDPGDWPSPNGAPLGLPSSGQLIGGALVLILGCILLGTPILSGLGALLLSETQVQDIMCISSVFTCVFLVLQMWVPANDNSPKLVEFD